MKDNNSEDKKKYPPFSEEFKEWCVTNNGMSKKSAGVYVSNIRTAYYNFCYSYKGLLEGIEKSFNEVISKESGDFLEIECWLEILDEYIDDLASLKNGISIEGRNDDWKDAPVSEWVNAFNNYRDFLEFKLQTLEHEILGGPAPKTEIPYAFPLKKWFFKYLRESKFKCSTIWTYSSRLDKSILFLMAKVVYNLIAFLENIPEIIKLDDAYEIVNQKFSQMDEILENELKLRKDLKGQIDDSKSFFSIQDLQDARLGLEQYKCFIKDVLMYPGKYSELLKDKAK